MNKVISFEQIQGFISNIRSEKRGFVTNFFWDANKHPYWIANSTLVYQEYDDCILMLHRDISFSNLYFIAVNYDAVKECVSILQSDETIVVDLVCRGEGNSELDTFASLGFEKYQSLYRMMHVGTLAKPEWDTLKNSVDYASEEDSVQIKEVFDTQFDFFCEQLPSIDEVVDYIERKQVLIIKDNANLCGFLIFELTGATWYLRYWYTSPDYRNKGIGSRLLKSSLAHGCDTKRQMFWVIADNENAIKRYEHYGFKRELMNDYVMIKRK